MREELVLLSASLLDAHWGEIANIEASSGFLPQWSKENFIADLPKKWELSHLFYLDGQIVGFCILSQKSDFCVHLHRVAIVQSKQNQGYGTKFLNLIIEKIFNEYRFLTLKVLKSDVPVVNFYKKLGFLPIFDDVQYSTQIKILNGDF